MHTNLTNLYNYMHEFTWVGTEKSLTVLCFLNMFQRISVQRECKVVIHCILITMRNAKLHSVTSKTRNAYLE